LFKHLPYLLIVADLAHRRDRCSKCRRGSCLLVAFPPQLTRAGLVAITVPLALEGDQPQA
jgi:hypothetical protein